MKRALEWGQLHMGLRDWKIEFHYTDRRPDWWCGDDVCGLTKYWPERRTALVYVFPSNCGGDAFDKDPLQTLFHELMHVRLAAMGFEQEEHELATEWACNDFAAIIRKAYR